MRRGATGIRTLIQREGRPTKDERGGTAQSPHRVTFSAKICQTKRKGMVNSIIDGKRTRRGKGTKKKKNHF